MRGGSRSPAWPCSIAISSGKMQGFPTMGKIIATAKPALEDAAAAVSFALD